MIDQRCICEVRHADKQVVIVKRWMKGVMGRRHRSEVCGDGTFQNDEMETKIQAFTLTYLSLRDASAFCCAVVPRMRALSRMNEATESGFVSKSACC